MRQDQQRKLDALYRVQNFLDTHAGILGTLKDSAARKQIDEAVAQMRGHITSQGSSDRVLAGQNSRLQALAKELIRKHMAPMAKFARAKLRGVPDFSTLGNCGYTTSPKTLVSAALSMAKAAAPYADAMTTAGFPPDSIAQLTAAAQALDAATIKRDSTRVGRVESTTNIKKLLDLGRDGVRILDAVISKRFESDEAVLAAWQSASRVDDKPGSVRTPAPSAAPAAAPIAAITAASVVAK